MSLTLLKKITMSKVQVDYIKELIDKYRLNKTEAVYLRNVYNTYNKVHYEGCLCSQTERNLFVPFFSSWFVGFISNL